MSVAANFNYYRPFPFCVEEFDIDSIDLSTVVPSVFFIRDLTLADAMALFWNTESFSFQFSASGVGFYDSTYAAPGTGVGATSYTAVFGSPVIPPSERVCESSIFSGTWNTFFDPDPVVGRIDWDDSGTPDDEWTGNLSYILPSFSGGGGYLVTRQLDDLYTFWLKIEETIGNPIIASGGGTDFGINPTFVNFNYADVSVLSGTMRIYGAAYNVTGSLEYTSGGTLGTVALTPTFYTYA